MGIADEKRDRLLPLPGASAATALPISMHDAVLSPPRTLSRHGRLAACAVGILTFFLVYGLTQEKLMTTSYDGERFTDTALLVLINRVVAMAVALCIIMAGRNSNESLRPVAPLRFYAFISISNFVATFCQYEALKYVTFPTQTLGKCGKMIPVLLIGSLLQKKQYSAREYGIAVMVTLGCTVFMTTGDVTYKSAAPHDTPFGLLLILVYLAADGFTSTTQESLFRSYKTSTNNQMLYVNIFSALFSVGALLLPCAHDANELQTSRLWPALHFVVAHPQVLWDSLLLSLCSSLGQLIIYYTIKEFGALVYSTIMTTRQFFGIFLSAMLFTHSISAPQWFGATVVFGSLYYRSVMKKDSAHRSDKKELAQQPLLKSIVVEPRGLSVDGSSTGSNADSRRTSRASSPTPGSAKQRHLTE